MRTRAKGNYRLTAIALGTNVRRGAQFELKMSGTLYLCATPIGNLEDMTFRAVRVLKEVDLIAAEDTRNSRKLLNHFDIHTELTSYHEHNKWDKGRTLIEKLLSGKDVALVTDAGMPGVSDPGFELVRMACEEGIKISPIPGATASVCALVISGLESRYFAFEGFLPTDKKERQKRLKKLEREERTILLYEAPHRLNRTLRDLIHTLGEDRKAAAVRELTKKFETVERGDLKMLARIYEEREPRGEFVLVVEGRDASKDEDESRREWEALSVKEHYELYIAAGSDRHEAMRRVAGDRGLSKRDIYKELVQDR